MRIGRLFGGFLVLAALAGLSAVSVGAGVECDPEPIGRCGEFQRERAVFCYVINQQGQMVAAGDRHVIALGGDDGVTLDDSQEKGMYYVRLRPFENFANDPMNAPAPQKPVWKETNQVPGLQLRASTCADFIWFAECVPQQWMGPFNENPTPPDTAQ